jgi:hypothetical protein
MFTNTLQLDGIKGVIQECIVVVRGGDNNHGFTRGLALLTRRRRRFFQSLWKEKEAERAEEDNVPFF